MAAGGRRAVKVISVVVLALSVLLVGTWATLRQLWPPINDVTTGATPEYPELQPQVFTTSPDATFEAVQQAVGDVPRMRVIRVDAAALSLEGEADTPSGAFTDDLTVTVRHAGDGGAEVSIRSRSRVGRSDFGQNARNVEELQAAIARRIPSPAP